MPARAAKDVDDDDAMIEEWNGNALHTISVTRVQQQSISAVDIRMMMGLADISNGSSIKKEEKEICSCNSKS